MGKAKIGISLYTYGADLLRNRMTVEEAIEHAASLGVKGIELVPKQHIRNFPYPRIYDLQRLRDYIESFGMEVSCYSTYLDQSVRSDRTATIDEMIDSAHEQIAQATLLGAKVYRPIIMGFAEVVSSGYDPKKVEEYYQKSIKIIRAVLSHIKRSNIKLGIEIHAPASPDFMLNLIRRVNDESVGLVPDFSVWQTRQVQATHVVGGYPPETLKKVLPYAVHIHAKAHSFNEKGEEENTPYDQLIPIIKESGFDGYISAEFEGWWDGTDFDSRKIAKIHVELIRRYL